MTTEFIWQLPTGSDGRHGDATPTRRGERFNYFDHIHQVARAADISGFDGIQIRNDPEGDETWIVAGYVAGSSPRSR